MDTLGANIVCPKPDSGKYECGLQVTPKMIKTKGKVREQKKAGMCGQDEDRPWVDYEVVAPHTISGGDNDDQVADALWEACIRSCGDGDPHNFDCDGVKSAQANGLAICPDVSGTQSSSFAVGWCTGHIVQRQRWQDGIGDRYVLSLMNRRYRLSPRWQRLTNDASRFKFDIHLLDHNKNEMTMVNQKQVDENGNYSLTSPLPYTLEIKTTGEDNDPVRMCYADQCWTCPGDDAHGW